MAVLSEKDLDAILAKNPAVKVRTLTPVTIHNGAVFDVSAEVKGPKYWNTKVYIYANGLMSEGKPAPQYGKPAAVYDSRREYLRACQLVRLEKANQISDLRRQVRFELEPQGEYNGVKIRAEYYFADFTYVENGELVVEDVKAFSEKSQKFRTTELFRSKWNRMKRRHPQYRFVVIDPYAGKQQ